MTSKLGAYLKTKEATGTTGHTDLPNPNADLNPNSITRQWTGMGPTCSCLLPCHAAQAARSGSTTKYKMLSYRRETALQGAL